MLYYQNSFKRIFDFIISIILIIILLPVFFIISTLLLIFYNKKIIYKHERIGKDKKKFNLYKFRSMHLNANAILNKYFIKSWEDIFQKYNIVVFYLSSY